MAAGKLSEINVTPLVDVLLVLLIIFMVTTAIAQQRQTAQQKQKSLQQKTQSLIDLHLPVTPENALLADPNTTKLVLVIDRKLRIFVVKGLNFEAGQKPIADCSSSANASDIEAWRPCIDIVRQSLAQNHRMLTQGLYLQADAKAPYGFVAAVLKELRAAGLESVDIVTNPHFGRSGSSSVQANIEGSQRGGTKRASGAKDGE